MEPCGCIQFEWDGDDSGDGVVRTCTCGHVDDEHDEFGGACLVEVEIN